MKLRMHIPFCAAQNGTGKKATYIVIAFLLVFAAFVIPSFTNDFRNRAKETADCGISAICSNDPGAWNALLHTGPDNDIEDLNDLTEGIDTSFDSVKLHRQTSEATRGENTITFYYYAKAGTDTCEIMISITENADGYGISDAEIVK